ncbi:hypothetical protein [Streptomyces yerevanensis]|uniref:hypothetical protein n=1 Tax=Streptomyces yerevanensis TaxID=66378 RepID=UPI00099740A2|nr:hypothetical protein [Streptomyces yerevanensis]
MSGDSPAAGAGRVQRMGETAQQEASATADRARQAAGEVTETAAEQARAVTSEARQQAVTVVRDLRESLTGQAEAQTRRAAGTLRKWADDLSGLARHAPDDSPTHGLVAQAAQGSQRAAEYLDRQGPQGLVTDVEYFARRRPGVFLGGAALAGFLVGRLAKAGYTAQRPAAHGPARAAATAPAVTESVSEGAPRQELPGHPEV